MKIALLFLVTGYILFNGCWAQDFDGFSGLYTTFTYKGCALGTAYTRNSGQALLYSAEGKHYFVYSINQTTTQSTPLFNYYALRVDSYDPSVFTGEGLLNATTLPFIDYPNGPFVPQKRCVRMNLLSSDVIQLNMRPDIVGWCNEINPNQIAKFSTEANCTGNTNAEYILTGRSSFGCTSDLCKSLAGTYYGSIYQIQENPCPAANSSGVVCQSAEIQISANLITVGGSIRFRYSSGSDVIRYFLLMAYDNVTNAVTVQMDYGTPTCWTQLSVTNGILDLAITSQSLLARTNSDSCPSSGTVEANCSVALIRGCTTPGQCFGLCPGSPAGYQPGTPISNPSLVTPSASSDASGPQVTLEWARLVSFGLLALLVLSLVQ